MNLDADAYLEPVNWNPGSHALLGLDLNNDGQLQGGELLTAGQLVRYDSNHDGTIDSQDPVYAAGSSLQQLGARDLQRIGNLLNIVQRDIARLPLHMGNEGAVQVSLKGQCLLRPATLLAHVGCQHLTRRAALGPGRRPGRQWAGTEAHGRQAFEPAAFKSAWFVSRFKPLSPSGI